MLLLSMGMSLSGWLPAVRFIPSKDIATAGNSSRIESVDNVPQCRNAATTVTVPGIS